MLRLFVTGKSWRSVQSIETLRKICRERLAGRHELEVIDLKEHPERAREDQIFALPTLVMKEPRPLRHVIGNLWNEDRVLSLLHLDAGPARAAR